jgi:hypothetical protein
MVAGPWHPLFRPNGCHATVDLGVLFRRSLSGCKSAAQRNRLLAVCQGCRLGPSAQPSFGGLVVPHQPADLKPGGPVPSWRQRRSVDSDTCSGSAASCWADRPSSSP